MPPLPPDLLAALVAPGGGRVVLILGAGCSVEPPTSLRLSREYAREAHHHLVADHILDQGQCPNPDDLSSVADSVWEATGSQEELIRRLPVAEFRNAAANDGYILAAALLREHVIACVMTLNFDLAMSQALASVGAKGDVSTIGGPQDHGNLGLINLIYLHRNAHAPANDWILRSTALQQLWQGAWEEAITHRVVAAAVTVFAGLGSPAAVLIETTQRIRGMLGNAAAIYQVDRVAAHQSAFFAALGLPAAAYIRTPWTQFMRELAQRVVVEHREELRAACLILQESEGWEPEDVDQLCDRVLDLGLLGLGQLRARWLLSDMPYIPRYMSNVSHIADLMLVVRLIERRSTTSAKLGSDGVVEFWEGDRMRASLLCVSGRGQRRWGSLEAEVRRSEPYWRYKRRIRHVIVAGVHGARPQQIAPPEDLVREATQDDLIGGDQKLQLSDVDDIRSGVITPADLFD